MYGKILLIIVFVVLAEILDSGITILAWKLKGIPEEIIREDEVNKDFIDEPLSVTIEAIAFWTGIFLTLVFIFWLRGVDLDYLLYFAVAWLAFAVLCGLSWILSY